MRKITFIGITALSSLLVCSGCGKIHKPVWLVKNGAVRAVVVTADEPSLTAAYAAEELVTHVEKATGKRLQIVTEDKIPEGFVSRIFVGVTKAARANGINPDTLGNDEFILRTNGPDLYVLGKEDFFGSPPPDRYSEDIRIRRKADRMSPLSLFNQYSGTLFGVYEIIERYLGARWLWPGELGTYLPRAQTVAIGALDEKSGPRLLFRLDPFSQYQRRYLDGVELGRGFKPIPQSYHVPISEKILRDFVFPSEEAGHKYGKALEVFERRHRMGTSYLAPRVPRTSHYVASIPDWWGKYGKDHPEWFAMNSEGTRGPKKGEKAGQVALCVSNPELHKFIVNEAWGRGNQLQGPDVLQLGEADVGGDRFCQCPNCLAWDGPQPKDFPEIVRNKYTPRMVSDRYARFWKTIYEMAVKKNPNVKIPVYIYHNYFPAPLTDIKLNKNIVGEFVTYGNEDGWYPMSAEEDKWTREQWLGWEKTGITLFYRPNYLYGFEVVPDVCTWQAGEFLRFAYKHGMSGATYEDGQMFHWAAHGPMAYMHMRLMWRPELEIKAIRKEYFLAFGPAAGYVEKYFDYWENYTRNRPVIGKDGILESQYGPIVKLRRRLGAYLAYPPEVYPPAEALLGKALEAARKDPNPEFAERVKFLQAGLKHALLSTRICKFLEYNLAATTMPKAPADPEKLKQARQAMRELSEFRRAPENLFVADYISAVEREFWGDPCLSGLFEGTGKALANPLPEPPASWMFRSDPDDRGVKEEWFKAAMDDNQWKPIKVPAFWPKSEKGDCIVGYGWYRAAFTVPENWRGRSIHFLFGAVDEQAWVYVNGQPAGEHTVKSQGLPVDKLWEKPFTLEVKSEFLKYGEKNLLSVRVHNSAFEGGIWKPVIAGYISPEEKAGLDQIDQYF